MCKEIILVQESKVTLSINVYVFYHTQQPNRRVRVKWKSINFPCGDIDTTESLDQKSANSDCSLCYSVLWWCVAESKPGVCQVSLYILSTKPSYWKLFPADVHDQSVLAGLLTVQSCPVVSSGSRPESGCRLSKPQRGNVPRGCRRRTQRRPGTPVPPHQLPHTSSCPPWCLAAGLEKIKIPRSMIG